MALHNDTTERARGFTLVEVMIYISLFSVMMTMVIGTAYVLITSAGQNDQKLLILDEGHFLMQKLSSLFIGATPTGVGYSGALTLLRPEGGQVDACLFDEKIYLRRSPTIGTPPPCLDPSFVPLTSDHVVVSALSFYTTTTPVKMIQASSTISGEIFRVSVSTP
jgi:prepilin-type N-terminal cleavage/methylation domain-containing protein